MPAVNTSTKIEDCICHWIIGAILLQDSLINV